MVWSVVREGSLVDLDAFMCIAKLNVVELE